MSFHADSEFDFKTTPNQVEKQILSKIRFLCYFDLKFPHGPIRLWASSDGVAAGGITQRMDHQGPRGTPAALGTSGAESKLITPRKVMHRTVVLLE